MAENKRVGGIEYKAVNSWDMERDEDEDDDGTNGVPAFHQHVDMNDEDLDLGRETYRNSPLHRYVALFGPNSKYVSLLTCRI